MRHHWWTVASLTSPTCSAILPPLSVAMKSLVGAILPPLSVAMKSLVGEKGDTMRTDKGGGIAVCSTQD